MQLWLIPLLPLAGFAVNGLLGRRLPKAAINAVAVGSVLLSFLWVLKTLSALGVFGGGTPLEQAYTEHYYTWIQSGTLNIGVDFAIDRLTAVMLMIVTGVGFLIHVYSVGYMAHEGGYYRFFAYLNLFMFFMLVLVLAANFLLLFVGWEGVGLCSYLLIGFYFDQKFATDAGNKAFIVNRIGDFGFSLAVFLIVVHFGSLDFATVFGKVQAMPVESSAGWMTAIALLLFVGATGKSAQIPLYVWLPDAMAGPTPVSALIHAATMVTAGIYLVARLHFLFVLAPWVSTLIAVIGILTAFFAATIALVQNDIKKVLAYSTISQLGYMFLGVGVTSYESGIFHLITHGFFKACLFLAAGSVIHALSGEQDIRKMGGLLKHIPVTSLGFLLGWIAITGILPTCGGFFSKDEILWKALATPNSIFPTLPQILYFAGLATSFLTAVYMTRLVILVFFGHYRGDHEVYEHLHESPRTMTWPVLFLGVSSLFIGWIGVPVAIGGADELGKFLDPLFHLSTLEANALPRSLEPMLMLVSFGVVFLGVMAAWYVYSFKPNASKNLTQIFAGAKKVLDGKYFVDEFYNVTVVRLVKATARWVSGWVIETLLVNRLVEWGVRGVTQAAQTTRKVQVGLVRAYLVYVTAGAALLIYLLLH